MEAVMMVPKESIGQYKFNREEVMEALEDRKDRAFRLIRALKLGNAYHGKVKITFQTRSGVKSVETTVWAVGDRYVSLKAGIHIPISSILEVAF